MQWPLVLTGAGVLLAAMAGAAIRASLSVWAPYREIEGPGVVAAPIVWKSVNCGSVMHPAKIAAAGMLMTATFAAVELRANAACQSALAPHRIGAVVLAVVGFGALLLLVGIARLSRRRTPRKSAATHRRLLLGLGTLAVLAGSTVGIGVPRASAAISGQLAVFSGVGNASLHPITTTPFVVTGGGTIALQWRFTSGHDLTVDVLDASTDRPIETASLPEVLRGLPGSTPVIANDFAVNAVDYNDPTHGEVGVFLPGGSYRLKVAGDAPWSVRVLRMPDAPASKPPHIYRGTGPQLVGPIAAGRELAISASAAGPSLAVPPAFGVELFTARSGRPITLALSGSAPYRGSTVLGHLPTGPDYLMVFATTRWTLTVSSS